MNGFCKAFAVDLENSSPCRPAALEDEEYGAQIFRVFGSVVSMESGDKGSSAAAASKSCIATRRRIWGSGEKMVCILKVSTCSDILDCIPETQGLSRLPTNLSWIEVWNPESRIQPGTEIAPVELQVIIPVVFKLGMV
jgi:hypothetical protein